MLGHPVLHLAAFGLTIGLFLVLAAVAWVAVSMLICDDRLPTPPQLAARLIARHAMADFDAEWSRQDRRERL
ncbi:MAG: hypothetical protein ABWX96_13665 [Propionibacteriaceae bacterium]